MIDPRIQALIGKPFAEYGRGPDFYDCWGLAMDVGAILGHKIPDYGSLSYSDPEMIQKQFRANICDFDALGNPQTGALILFKRVDGGLHFGVVIDGQHFVHVRDDGLGVQICSLNHPLYRQLVKGYYRLSL